MSLSGPQKTFETLDLQACGQFKKMLNSERIKYLFGSYGVEVLNNTTTSFPGCRISNLHSLHDGQKIKCPK